MPELQPAPLAFDVAAAGGSVPSALTEKARSEARAVGYAKGWSTGIREAREAMAAELANARLEADRLVEAARTRLASALRAIDVAATAMEQQSVPSAAEVEIELLHCAVDLAETLLTHELRHINTAEDALARTLSLAPVGEPVTVALCPQDFAALALDGQGTIYPQLASTYQREINLVRDASLTPGDAVVRCGATTIDGRLSAGVARVREALES